MMYFNTDTLYKIEFVGKYISMYVGKILPWASVFVAATMITITMATTKIETRIARHFLGERMILEKKVMIPVDRFS